MKPSEVCAKELHIEYAPRRSLPVMADRIAEHSRCNVMLELLRELVTSKPGSVSYTCAIVAADAELDRWKD